MTKTATTQDSHHYDTIVIGSGIGGLCAALTVARNDRRVLVLEAGKQFGGFLNPFKRGKYGFDPGLHYIGECSPGRSFDVTLEKLGIRDRIRFRELSPDGFEKIRFPNYSVMMPKGAENYRARLLADFPHEQKGIDQFFGYLRDLRALSAASTKPPGPLGAISLIQQLPFALRFGRATYGALLDSLFKDPLLKAVLAAQGGDYGLPPSRASALIGLGLIDHYLGGAFFPVGGSRALRDTLVSAIQEHGGIMKRNYPVQQITITDGFVTGVRCENGEEFSANSVISNADVATTYRELVGAQHLSSSVVKKLDRTKPTLGSICMFMGTDLDVAAAGMTDANIWHYDSIDLEGVYKTLTSGRLPDESLFFLSSPSLKDPEGHLSPPGHNTLEFVTLAPFEMFSRWQSSPTMKRGDEYEALKEKLSDRFLSAIDQYVPGIKQHLKVCEVATPVTNISFARTPKGSIYGPEATPDMMGPFRYQPQTEIPGLYLAGSSVLGGGIVPAAVSGYMAGKVVLASLRGKKPLGVAEFVRLTEPPAPLTRNVSMGKLTEIYTKQHEGLMLQAMEIIGLLQADIVRKEPAKVRKLLCRFAGSLTVHAATEEGALYPQLLSHPNDNIRARARELLEEVGPLYLSFEAYMKRWPNTESMALDAETFIRETKRIFKQLGHRMMTENTDLYPLVDNALRYCSSGARCGLQGYAKKVIIPACSLRKAYVFSQ